MRRTGQNGKAVILPQCQRMRDVMPPEQPKIQPWRHRPTQRHEGCKGMQSFAMRATISERRTHLAVPLTSQVGAHRSQGRTSQHAARQSAPHATPRTTSTPRATARMRTDHTEAHSSQRRTDRRSLWHTDESFSDRDHRGAHSSACAQITEACRLAARVSRRCPALASLLSARIATQRSHR